MNYAVTFKECVLTVPEEQRIIRTCEGTAADVIAEITKHIQPIWMRTTRDIIDEHYSEIPVDIRERMKYSHGVLADDMVLLYFQSGFRNKPYLSYKVIACWN